MCLPLLPPGRSFVRPGVQGERGHSKENGAYFSCGLYYFPAGWTPVKEQELMDVV